MNDRDSHLSDELLLLELDAECSARERQRVQSHLGGCWKCRARRQELEHAIAGFVRAHRQDLDARLPPVSGSRALLKARIAEIPQPATHWPIWALGTAAVFVLVLAAVLIDSISGRRESFGGTGVIVSIPDTRLTPGAALLANTRAVCGAPNTRNKAVPVALQRKVFEEYGIAGAEPRAYEVDYLVTPALGGVDDIHNLWPHSYSATVWNAHVKDALEDRLREMVCDGDLDLPKAQQEIAGNWIAAYKKYFHTEEPLLQHIR